MASVRAPLSTLNPCAAVFIPGKQFSVDVGTEKKGAVTTQIAEPLHQLGLPAVVSIKKSSRGCAVVILRDATVHRRALAQKVAVIDGVCVEVKNHQSKRAAREGTTEQEMGVFVAWGQRVERRVTVSEEALEDHFNGLAADDAAFSPRGLTVEAPFQEDTVHFALKSSRDAKSIGLVMDPEIDQAEETKLLCNSFCPKEAVQGLWKAKGRLDELWNRPPPPMARSLMTRIARAELFPHSGEGGKEHANRAGDKLSELSDYVGLLDGVPYGSAFLDLCGGPGAWSQFVFDQCPGLNLRGFGLTLRSGAGDSNDWHAASKDDWYPELMHRRDWRAVWGRDGTGDLLKPGNLEHCAKELSKKKVFLCLADGGFSDDSIPANQLELYFYRLLLGELLMAASCLQPDGRFVCKLYSTFSQATQSLLFLTTRLFKQVCILKPQSSRVTGPERYLVAFGFRGIQSNGEIGSIVRALQRAHSLANGASPLITPLLSPMVAADDLAQDTVFMEAARMMTMQLCDRQQTALNAVVDRAIGLEEMALRVADALEAKEESKSPTTADKENQPPVMIENKQEQKMMEAKDCYPSSSEETMRRISMVRHRHGGA